MIFSDCDQSTLWAITSKTSFIRTKISSIRFSSTAKVDWCVLKWLTCCFTMLEVTVLDLDEPSLLVGKSWTFREKASEHRWSILYYALSCLSRNVWPNTSLMKMRFSTGSTVPTLSLYPILFFSFSCINLWNCRCLFKCSESSRISLTLCMAWFDTYYFVCFLNPPLYVSFLA